MSFLLTMVASVVTAGGEPLRLAFDPQPGTAVGRTIDGALDVELLELTLRGPNGGTVDVLPLVGLDEHVHVGGRLRTADVYRDEPLVLSRCYDVIDTRWALGRRCDSYRVLHPLTYRTVSFERDASGDVHARWGRGRRGDRDVLRALEWDLEGLALLPGHAIVVGERWEVPLAELGSVLLLGGRLHRHAALWEELGLSSLEASLARELDGRFAADRVTCQCSAVDERCATIRFDFEHALDARFERLAVQGLGLLEGAFELDAEGSGRLRWDHVAGRADALTLRVDFELAALVRADEADAALELELRGVLAWDMRVEPR